MVPPIPTGSCRALSAPTPTQKRHRSGKREQKTRWFRHSTYRGCNTVVGFPKQKVTAATIVRRIPKLPLQVVKTIDETVTVEIAKLDPCGVGACRAIQDMLGIVDRAVTIQIAQNGCKNKAAIRHAARQEIQCPVAIR